MKTTLQALIAISFLAFNLGAEIIPADRRVDWLAGTTVGVRGGIPTNFTQWADITVNIPGTNIVADPTGVSDNAAAFHAAGLLCPSNQFSHLPTGRYLLTSRVVWTGDFGLPWVNNRLFRGDSARTTNTTIVLRITNSSHHAFTFGVSRVADGGGGPFQGGSAAVALTNNLPTGATNVTLTAVPADVFAGSIIWFDELNDDGLATAKGSGWATNTAGATAYDRPRNGTRNRASYHRVLSVAGTTITFSPPIPLGFTTNQSAIAIGPMSTRSGAAYGCGIGWENINFEQDPTASMGAVLRMASVTDCWVKDCRFNLIKSRAIQPVNTVHCEFTGNDFIKAGAFTVNAGYIMEATHMGGCLIENNAADEWYVGVILENSSYNVIAANAFYWSHSTSPNVQISDLSTHAAFCTKNLWEANAANRIQLDFYHGSSAINTIFRNHLRGVDTNITQNRFSLMIDTKSVSNNVVGNVLGDPSVFWFTALTNYNFDNNSNMLMRLGYPEIGNNRYPSNSGTNYGTLDLNVTNTLILHGNYYRTEASAWATQWDGGIADTNLPSSFYRTAKPAYWGTWAWPAFGTDLASQTNTIPAMARLFGLTPPGGGSPPPPEVANDECRCSGRR